MLAMLMQQHCRVTHLADCGAGAQDKLQHKGAQVAGDACQEHHAVVQSNCWRQEPSCTA